MKHVILTILLVLVVCFAKGQECDSVFLTNGIKFIGSLQSRDGSLITFKYCEPNIFQTITVRLYECTGRTYDKFHLVLENEKIKRKERKRINELDTNRYFHIGIIPYQLLTRSSDLYVGYDFKKVGIEWRPSYTYATNVKPGEIFLSFYNDNYFLKV